MGHDQLRGSGVERITAADSASGSVELDVAVVGGSYRLVAEDREHRRGISDRVILALDRIGQLQLRGGIVLGTVYAGDGGACVQYGIYGKGVALVERLLNLGVIGVDDGDLQRGGLGLCGRKRRLGRNRNVGVEGSGHIIAHAGLGLAVEYDTGEVVVGSSQCVHLIGDVGITVRLDAIGRDDQKRIIGIEIKTGGGGTGILDDAGVLRVGDRRALHHGEYGIGVDNIAVFVDSVGQLQNSGGVALGSVDGSDLAIVDGRSVQNGIGGKGVAYIEALGLDSAVKAVDPDLCVVDGGSRIGEGRFTCEGLAFLNLTLEYDPGQIGVVSREVFERVLDFRVARSVDLIGGNDQLRGSRIESKAFADSGLGSVINDFAVLRAVRHGEVAGHGEYLDGIYKLAVLTADLIDQRKNG